MKSARKNLDEAGDPREAIDAGAVAGIWAVDDGVGAGPGAGCGGVDGGGGLRGSLEAQVSWAAHRSQEVGVRVRLCPCEEGGQRGVCQQARELV